MNYTVTETKTDAIFFEDRETNPSPAKRIHESNVEENVEDEQQQPQKETEKKTLIVDKDAESLLLRFLEKVAKTGPMKLSPELQEKLNSRVKQLEVLFESCTNTFLFHFIAFHITTLEKQHLDQQEELTQLKRELHATKAKLDKLKREISSRIKLEITTLDNNDKKIQDGLNLLTSAVEQVIQQLRTEIQDRVSVEQLEPLQEQMKAMRGQLDGLLALVDASKEKQEVIDDIVPHNEMKFQTPHQQQTRVTMELEEEGKTNHLATNINQDSFNERLKNISMSSISEEKNNTSSSISFLEEKFKHPITTNGGGRQQHNSYPSLSSFTPHNRTSSQNSKTLMSAGNKRTTLELKNRVTPKI